MRTLTTEHQVGTYSDWLAHDKEHGTKVHEKILEKHRNMLTEDDWHNGVIDNFKEALEAHGFYDVDVLYTGFWSQGDGASWTSESNVTLEQCVKNAQATGYLALLSQHLCTADHCRDKESVCLVCHNSRHEVLKFPMPPRHVRRLKDADWSFQVVRRQSMPHYVHENTVAVDVSSHTFGYVDPKDSDYPRIETALEDYEKDLREWLTASCKGLYAALERAHEYLSSDEVLAEYFDENDYEFYDDGGMV